MRLRKVSHPSSFRLEVPTQQRSQFLFSSQMFGFLDYSKGFGGKYGVEREKVDKAALGYDYKGETEKHQSQKGEFML